MNDILDRIWAAARLCDDEDFMTFMVQHNLLRQRVRAIEDQTSQLKDEMYKVLRQIQGRERDVEFVEDLRSLGMLPKD